MSKYEKGQTVWVRGTLDISERGALWVKIPCEHVMRDDGECDVCVSASQIKPDVTFPWSPAKAKKKARKQ